MKNLSSSSPLIAKKLLLVGAGHAHIGLLRQLANKRFKNTNHDRDITVITEQPQTLYSGMLPGWMAGHYHLDDISIDIVELCSRAGVPLVQRPIIAVDADKQTVATATKECFDYEVLSLNTGADTDLTWLKQNSSEADVDTKNDTDINEVMPVRPIFNFVEQWQQILQQARQTNDYKVAVVGAGAAATELVMAAQFALRQINPNHHAYLICGEHLLSGFDKVFSARVIKQLQRHDIEIIYERATHYSGGQLQASNKTLATYYRPSWNLMRYASS